LNTAVWQVRDVYDSGDFIISVTSDRQSAFDRMLCAVPFKGQVLNQTSVWWFENTRHIIPNAFVASPHPYVTVMQKAKVILTPSPSSLPLVLSQSPTVISCA
jgi:phosphoribosylaminoimidazole-succinocarboxamide synthase